MQQTTTSLILFVVLSGVSLFQILELRFHIHHLLVTLLLGAGQRLNTADTEYTIALRLGDSFTAVGIDQGLKQRHQR